MSKHITMQNIADAVGVTKVSVSKALNHQPGISENLRQRIIKTADKMGYVKSLRATNDKKIKLAWICAKRFFLEDETFYTTIYYYINQMCIKAGYELTCIIIGQDEEMSCELPSPLVKTDFAGYFIAGEFKQDFLNSLQRLNGEKIAIDFYSPFVTMDSVIVDNFSAGTAVTNYLIAKGHRKIGFVGNIQDTSSICDRYFGYLKAMKLYGLDVNEEWHISNNDFMSGTYSSIDLPSNLPTAFICHCDKAALVLSQQLRAKNLRIPEDVSLISFDNTSICKALSPALTSVEINQQQIAQSGFELMMHRMKYSDRMVKKIYLTSHLVERDSVMDLHEK